MERADGRISRLMPKYWKNQSENILLDSSINIYTTKPAVHAAQNGFGTITARDNKQYACGH